MESVWLTNDERLKPVHKFILITQDVNNNPFPVVNSFCRWALTSSQKQEGRSNFTLDKAEINSSQVNLQKVAHPHMIHFSFLLIKSCNWTRGCHLPSLITQHSSGGTRLSGRKAVVRLARGVMTVIEWNMMDGCSWCASSVSNCCWVWLLAL